MDFNVKDLIDKAVSKLKSSPDLLAKFKAEPVKTLEGILGVDLPDEKVKAVVDGIKAKLSIDDAASKLKGLGSLFGKK